MLHFYIFAPFFAALLIGLFAKKGSRIHTGWFVLPVPAVLFILFCSKLPVLAEGKIVQSVANWIPSLDIQLSFYLDGLSMLFSLLITGIGSLVVLYSIYYLSKKEQLVHFYVYLLLFMGSMLGVVLSDNVFVLYTFWEFTSISSFLLIGFWFYRERSTYGAQKSMLVTVFGGLAMLGALILLSITAETNSIREIIANRTDIIESDLFIPILILLLIGAFTKSAQFPFHSWLPDAMEAPTPVSAYLHSATMVKAGIYLVARFSLIFSGTDIFFIIVTGAGLITLCIGSFLASRQTDLKGILAYSTISQLGMIMSMLGFGTGVATLAAIFHIFNHATFKGSLFMIAGIVDHETGTRDIRRLGGLYTFMPISATLAFFGAFSMAGIPLPIFNGFLSKEMFFDASLKLEQTSGFAATFAQWVPFLAVAGSIFTFVYSMYLVFGTFTGKAKLDQLEKKPHEAPIGMLISPIVLIGLVVLIGLLPNLINEPILAPAVASVRGDLALIHLKFWHGLNTPLYMSLIVVILGILLSLTLKKWQPVYNRVPGKFSTDRVYQGLVNGLLTFSKILTKSYMTGSLRLYTSIILVFLVISTSAFIYMTDGFKISFDNLAPVTWPEVLIGSVMAVAAIATIWMNQRIAAIIVIGVVGYGLSLLFVFFRAPDLALTQLIVETITVALFLLCFAHLPKLKKSDKKSFEKLLDFVIAASTGALLTIVAISSHSSQYFDSIAKYFVDNSYKLGGGDNIVNVILVDFRGLDTLFEIAVLGLAALGIFAMIKYRDKGDMNH
ncbi:cation:proton antiporter [Fictibacillus phosphorivorans]|uniref:Cation:proton antiporter n=1 Tax=Fictibacillus phosphorivorans TaxID=1221500 RepID=A0A163S9H9_9BACL|nr:Na+/H+ antiporter subunit A [Fictibacillus phosphorivorans]KZE68457.1 cation:proton antiporter [Fictibacillus phosphorivorans]